ncbi:hypothetical protein AB4Y42_35045 [Paraburkholderia sp. EG286B]|uniref:hypothetical protein n=1 Tax=Paraburkholderia sp. EG286B TaxID=3237011 RepID=UPI0034D2FE64
MKQSHRVASFVFGALLLLHASAQGQDASDGTLNAESLDQIEIVNFTNQIVKFSIAAGDEIRNFELGPSRNGDFPVDDNTGKSTVFINTDGSVTSLEVRSGHRYKIKFNSGIFELVEILPSQPNQ